MNDTAMLFASIPVTVLMGAFMLQQHVEWLRTNSAHALEYLAELEAYRAEQAKRVQDALAWADGLAIEAEPEPLRTYERAKGASEETAGVTTPWEEVTYN